MDVYIFQDLLYTIQKKKQVRYLVFFIGAALLAIAGWGIYQYITTKKSEAAQKAFSQALTEFEKTLELEPKDRKWAEIGEIFQKGHELFVKTAFGPYFLAYKAQALLQDQKYDAARDTINQVVSSLKKRTPLYYLYSIQQALMEIDAPDAAMSQAGKTRLEALASDMQNPEKDQALYYAGYYALQADDIEKAQRLWSQLITRLGGSRSPWVEAAQRELAVLAQRASKT